MAKKDADVKPGESPTDDPMDAHPLVRQARIDGTSVAAFVPGARSPVPGIEVDVLPEQPDSKIKAEAKEAAETHEAHSTTPPSRNDVIAAAADDGKDKK